MRNQFGLGLTIILGLIFLYYGFLSIKLLFPTKKKRIWGYVAYIGFLVVYALLFLNLRNFDANTKDGLYSWNLAYIMGVTVLHFFVALFFLIDDFRRMIVWLFKYFTPTKRKPAEESVRISRSKFLNRMGWMGGVTLFSSFFIGIKNKYNYQLRRVSIKVNKDAYAALKGLKFIHISDIHTGSFDDTSSVERGIDLINKENADFIFCTGDIVNNKTEEIYPYIDTLKKLKAKNGVYSILGNHDYGDYFKWATPEEKDANLAELKRIQVEELGWRLLMNEHEIISHNNKEFAIIGVENWGANMHFPKYGKMDDALAGIENKDCYKILLSHDPSHWDAEVKPKYSQIDLMLSGHTHGMQFGIDFSWFKWSPSQYVYKQWAGLYQDKQQQLYVNRGFGFLGYRGRVGILPEITVIEFEEAQENPVT